jgi:hypothetical protein
MIRYYADWLFLLSLRGVVLAAAIAIGASVVRNVTDTLQWAVHGCAAHQCSGRDDREACAGPPARGSCAAPLVARQRGSEAVLF